MNDFYNFTFLVPCSKYCYPPHNTYKYWNQWNRGHRLILIDGLTPFETKRVLFSYLEEPAVMVAIYAILNAFIFLKCFESDQKPKSSSLIETDFYFFFPIPTNTELISNLKF